MIFSTLGVLLFQRFFGKQICRFYENLNNKVKYLNFELSTEDGKLTETLIDLRTIF